MKKVGKYVIISLLLLLGLCCVGILYLFFVPNSTLFNITYINHHKTIKSEKFNVSAISKIDVNSRSYDVKILPTDTEYVYSKVYSNSFGFVLKKNSTISVETSVSNNVLTINVIEPHGFATKNDSYIEIYVPESNPLDLELCNYKAKTIIDGENIQINNLSYSTTNGDFDFNNGEIKGSLNLDIEKSTFTIEKNVKTYSNNVKLGTTKGKFIASSSKLGDVTISKNTHGVISINECAVLSQDIESAGGSISIEKALRLIISTSDTNISVNEISNGASIILTQSGKVHIKNLSGYSTIHTNSANVQIDNCNNEVIVHTTSGNITINNAFKTVRIKTDSGNAVVNFSKSASNYTNADGEKSRTLYATIANGTLSATGVQHIGVPNTNADETITGITITGGGSVNLNMGDVLGKNQINGNNGNVSVLVNDNSQYVLSTHTNTGNVRVNLLQIPQSGGYTDKNHEPVYVNCSPCSTCDNCKSNKPCENLSNLTMNTTNGNLLVLDQSMYNYGF